MNIEPLEARIAPATITFADVDGDIVTITTSKGTNDQLSAILTLAPEGFGMEIREIDFSANAAVFSGTDLTVAAKRTSTGGDGRVNVGYIDAITGNDGASLNLGNVRIAGDLGRLDAGTSSATIPAVKLLKVQSMGEFDTSTQGTVSELVCDFYGALGKLVVVGNIREVNINAHGAVVGKIGSVTIGGSLIGGAPDSAQITSDVSIGSVKIRGDFQGGTGSNASVIDAPTIGAVTIGGSMLGTGFGGTRITGGSLGFIKIGGDLNGSGGGSKTGAIIANTIAGVTIGGSLIGGSDSASDSGVIKATGAIGPVKIGGDIVGGSASTGFTVQRSGGIFAGSLASLTVGGSILAGRLNNGMLIDSGAVRVEGPIGAILIKGSIVGDVFTKRAVITALGTPASTGATDLAIKSLTVGGRVERTDILAGYDTSATPVGVNADAQIGRVVVGDWIASNLIAGAQDDATATLNATFGNGDDQKIADANDAGGVVSRIASIFIKGTALGTITGSDHFGFVAQQIGSFKIGTTVFPLAPGAASIADIAGLAVGATGDLRIREVAL